MAVSANKTYDVPCGTYRITKEIDASIYVTANATLKTNTASNPIFATSSMCTRFSAVVGIDVLIDAYYNLIDFFKYITYRQNIYVGDVEVFFRRKDNLREHSGLLLFPEKYEREVNEKRQKRIITYDLLNEHSAKLLAAINDKLLGFRHLCNSIDDRSYYSASRIILIFAEFERVHRNIYEPDHGRSDEYIEVKAEIISRMKVYADSLEGKKRKYANNIIKYVEKRDNSLEMIIKNTLADNEDILSCSIRRRYSGSYSKVINEISSRMGKVRNAIAHSLSGLKSDPVHINDFGSLEQLIYVMMLKKISLSADECKKSIERLFL